MNGEKRLSLCVVTKDAEPFILDCLNGMKDAADEMVVADLGSADRTRELARQAGAAVYEPEWEHDFAKIKNFCLERAGGQWVLFLQADETISPRQQVKLKLLLKNPCAEGYLLNSGGMAEKRKISSPVQGLRLIRNRPEYRFCRRSFEHIPDEAIYALQDSHLHVIRHGGAAGGRLEEERIRLLEEDLKESPQDGYLQYLKGIDLLNRGNFAESSAEFESARQTVNWGYLYAPHLYQCLGISLFFQERYREAEDVFSEGIKSFPFYNDLLVRRAELYRRQGRFREAQADLGACLAMRREKSACVPGPEIKTSSVRRILREIQNSA